jgi:membrane protein implicated in regulation of membrane protease activity
MSGKIVGFLREYVLVLSILLLIPALLFIIMGVVFLFFISSVQPTTSPLHFIYQIGIWNDYILVLGLILLGVSAYYLYSFFTKRKYVLDELNTDKRSEILKKRSKLESTVKQLPSKYQKMLSDKEEEFDIR